MYTYSSTDDSIKDAIKFLKIGLENNETTLLLLSRDIEPILSSNLKWHYMILI